MFVTINKRFKITKRFPTTLSLVYSPPRYFSKEHQKLVVKLCSINNSFKDGDTILVANNCYQNKKKKPLRYLR